MMTLFAHGWLFEPSRTQSGRSQLQMFDYRLFFAGSTLDSTERDRRPILGHEDKRVYRLPAQRPVIRSKNRR